MKHVKTFEQISMDDQVELLRDTMMENPNYETHDFYIFIARDEYKEDEDGRYTKTIDIENMVKITPDAQSISAMTGMQLRVRFNADSTLYHIWLPKGLDEQVEGKGSNSIEPWLVDLINKHKMKGPDIHGKQVFKDVVQRGEWKGRRKNANKYNI